MKLKNILIIAFLTLTFIPFLFVCGLLYKSGFELSKELYTQNLVESINVQVDYISQTLEVNMISDYRFAHQKYFKNIDVALSNADSELLDVMRSYLESSEDKVTISILLNRDNELVYTIGEKNVVDRIMPQLEKENISNKQIVKEFDLGGAYSLGIVTPITLSNGEYGGSLVSIYDKTYLLKIISSYYKVSDTSLYICRSNGELVNFREDTDEEQNIKIADVLTRVELEQQGTINSDGYSSIGYYKNIHNTPWYLTGFIDDSLILNFVNEFVFIYIIIVILILLADICLAFYFSSKLVSPINDLINVMSGYQDDLNKSEWEFKKQNTYYETNYLRTKFFDLMQTIQSVQHNFKGVFQLYQSNDMSDINIDMDTNNQTIHSNRPEFDELMHSFFISDGVCVVERFTRCFCEEDEVLLLGILENMRDEHLSITTEVEIYTPYLNNKWYHALIVPMYEVERLSKLFIQLRDISVFKLQELESIKQAKQDPLSGLYNRFGFSDNVNNVLNNSHFYEFHGLLFIDMNYFKLVNDNFGHSSGDELLCLIAKDIVSCTRDNDIASRFGGDEFAIFMPNTTYEHLEEVKQTLAKTLIYPYMDAPQPFVVSASIGLAVWNKDLLGSLEQLLKKADETMYKAKRDFKDQS